MIDSSVSTGFLRLLVHGALDDLTSEVVVQKVRPAWWHEFFSRQKILKKRTVDGLICRVCMDYYHEHGVWPTESTIRRMIDKEDIDDKQADAAHTRLDTIMSRKAEPQSAGHYMSLLEENSKETIIKTTMVHAAEMLDAGRTSSAMDYLVTELSLAQLDTGDVSPLAKPMTGRELLLGLLNNKFSTAIMPFPYDSMTEKFGGLKKGEISIWAAKGATGKTFITHDIAYKMALSGYQVLLVELEMRMTTIGYRLLSGRTGIPISKIERGLLDKDERRLLKALNKELQNEMEALEDLDRFTYIGPDYGTTTADIERAIKLRKLKPDLVVIDYISLMFPNGATAVEDHSRVSGVLADLRSFALRHDVHVMSPVHLQSSGKTQYKVLDDKADVVYHLNAHEVYAPIPPDRRNGEWEGKPGIIVATATRNRSDVMAKTYLEVEYSCATIKDKPDFVEPRAEKTSKESKKES